MLDHSKWGWDAVKDLANAAFIETTQAMNMFNSNLSTSALEYERKKLRSAGTAARPTQGLSGGYKVEREIYLGAKKKANPVSGTTLHEAINALTDPNSISYDAKLAQELGGNKVLSKNFDAMTAKDWQTIEGIMQKMEKTQGTMKRHVLFLKKSERLAFMAIVQNGKLCKSDGTFWDTGAWDEPFAMDEYGNLFIGQGAVLPTTARLNHSSLLAGKDVLCAGTLQIQGGVLKKFNNNSGHYKPTGTHVYQGLLALQDEHVDLSQTVVTIMVSEAHGFGNLTVAQVMAAQGQFAQPHANYY